VKCDLTLCFGTLDERNQNFVKKQPSKYKIKNSVQILNFSLFQSGTFQFSRPYSLHSAWIYQKDELKSSSNLQYSKCPHSLP